MEIIDMCIKGLDKLDNIGTGIAIAGVLIAGALVTAGVILGNGFDTLRIGLMISSIAVSASTGIAHLIIWGRVRCLQNKLNDSSQKVSQTYQQNRDNL